jgi:hypothetical protein
MKRNPGMAAARSALVGLFAVAAMLALGSSRAYAADDASQVTERLQITDPYVELHTGPGRGFPVFFVEPRARWITIELRHTDWYRVRTDGAQVGWVQREQLRSTLAAAGEVPPFRELLLDDYLSRRAQLGVAGGRFNSEPMLKMWASYRLSETLAIEGTLGQVQGAFAGTRLWHVNLVSDPWSDRRFSPFFSIGVGKLKNFPNSSLVGASLSGANLLNASVGARYYLSERFVLRADYTLYTASVSDTRTSTFRAPTAGISFFF